MSLQISQLLSSISNYNFGRKDVIKYIVIHYTGNKDDTAQGNAKYFSNGNHKASAHYFVDEESIWLSVSENDTAWHCGTNKQYKHSRCRNANSIGIEICMLDKLGKVRFGSIGKAVELAKMLMNKYHVPAQNVLRHYDVTGKVCPQPFVVNEKLWDEFKASLIEKEEEEAMTGEQIAKELEKYYTEKQVPDWAKAEFDEAIKLGITDGKNPTELVPRYQLAIMVKRAIEKKLGGK